MRVGPRVQGEAREVEALLDEVERVEPPLAVLQRARGHLHHVLAYDGEEGDVDAHVAPALVRNVDRKAFDDEAGRRVDIALPDLHEMEPAAPPRVDPAVVDAVARGLAPLPVRLAAACVRERDKDRAGARVRLRVNG